ncbi:hypothetical protein [Allosphingosinicella indica]|uniref:hypothetical protein n=1 Tax=Allosphingosinicella indica TaxID=941907 RepID=UPI001FCDBD84|nr:hypothetical protein [Allosphingosinicella indica]
MSRLSDWELWACAHHMVERHGEDALCQAAQRADALLNRGDTGGYRTWCNIMAKAEELLAPPGPAH